MYYDELIEAGAELIGVSTETAKRYLGKMTSKYGKLERVPTFNKGWRIIYKKNIVKENLF